MIHKEKAGQNTEGQVDSQQDRFYPQRLGVLNTSINQSTQNQYQVLDPQVPI